MMIKRLTILFILLGLAGNSYAYDKSKFTKAEQDIIDANLPSSREAVINKIISNREQGLHYSYNKSGHLDLRSKSEMIANQVNSGDGSFGKKGEFYQPHKVISKELTKDEIKKFKSNKFTNAEMIMILSNIPGSRGNVVNKILANRKQGEHLYIDNKGILQNGTLEQANQTQQKFLDQQKLLAKKKKLKSDSKKQVEGKDVKDKELVLSKTQEAKIIKSGWKK